MAPAGQHTDRPYERLSDRGEGWTAKATRRRPGRASSEAEAVHGHGVSGRRTEPGNATTAARTRQFIVLEQGFEVPD